MLKKIISTSALSVALLTGSSVSTAAGVFSSVGTSSHAMLSAAYTAEQRALNTKGLQYHPSPSVKNRSRSYHFKESKKLHKPVKSKKRYYSNKSSKPNPSRKLSYRGGIV
jgi:hypothetical protein